MANKKVSKEKPVKVTREALRMIAAQEMDTFERLLRERNPLDIEMAKDLRQYNSEYDPSELKSFRNTREGACELYVGITRTKVRTMDARINDLALAGGTKNWEIKATPVPDLANVPDLPDEVPQEVRDAFTKEIVTESEARATAMDTEMADHLIQAKWVKHVRQVTHYGHKYGWGIMKGPLVARRTVSNYQPELVQDPITGAYSMGPWKQVTREIIQPYFESVSPWDFFADWSSPSVEDQDYLAQRHLFRHKRLLEFRNRKGFDKKVIDAHLKQYPDGNCRWELWEEDIYQTGAGSGGVGKPDFRKLQRKRWESIEIWTEVSNERLKLLGLADQAKGFGLKPNGAGLIGITLWVFRDTASENGSNPIVFGALLNTLPKQRKPYNFYVPIPEEGSLRGTSVPFMCRDPQRSINSFERMLHDNASTSVGPQIELRIQRMIDPSNLRRLYPYRIWPVKDNTMNPMAPAIQFTDFPNHTNTYLAAKQSQKAWLDEITGIPSYQHGASGSSGAGRTASGLSMLMGAAGLLVKDQLYAFDEFQANVLEATYDWEMAFNPKQEIKGDFQVNVQTTMAMLQKSQNAEAIRNFRLSTLNEDGRFTKRRYLLESELEAMDVNVGKALKSDKELQDEMEEMAKQQAQMEAEMGPTGAPPAQPGQPAPQGPGPIGAAEGGVVNGPEDPDVAMLRELHGRYPDFLSQSIGGEGWRASP
jgi:hypothetical protein